MLTKESIPALYGGVSQQPAPIRSAIQVDDQINFHSSIVNGLVRRPPSEFMLKVNSDTPSDVYSTIIKYNATTSYLVVIYNNTITVTNVSSTPYTSMSITYTAGFGYLASSNPSTDFKVILVGSDLIVLNKSITTSVSGLTVGGVLLSTVQSFANLPTTPANGDIHKIQGATDTAATSYYVIRSGGVWVETAGPGEPLGLNATGMPHKLRLSGGAWFFEVNTWSNRVAGDVNSAPTPSFVGSKLSDIFLYRNRMGFITGNKINLSEVGKYFNFYPKAVATVLSGDRLDFTVSDSQASSLVKAVVFDKVLMLFSTSAQFILSSTGPLTASSASVDLATAYPNSVDVAPTALGSQLYFVNNGETNSVLYEYITPSEPGTYRNYAENVTSHVPTFVAKNLSKMCSNENANVVVALSKDNSLEMFVYTTYWEGSEKKLSAWEKWSLGATGASSIEAHGDHLLLVRRRSDGLYVDRMNVVNIEYDSLLVGHQVYLDGRFTASATYNAGTNKSTVTLPYAIETTQPITVVLGSSFGTSKGSIVSSTKYTRPTTTTLELTGDYTGGLIIGVPFESSVVLSEFFLRDRQGIAKLGKRLQVIDLTLYYLNTGPFTVKVEPQGRKVAITGAPTYDVVFTGIVLGASTATIGQSNLHTGQFRCPVHADATRLKLTVNTDSPLGCSLQSAGWTGKEGRNNR